MSTELQDRKEKIIVVNGCYKALKQDNDTATSYYTRVSDFTMTINRCFVNTETGDISREVFLTGQHSPPVGPFVVDSETALTTAKFQAFAFSKGVFFWEGGKKELVEVWKRELEHADVFIQESPHIGYLEKFGCYVFDDLAILPKEQRTIAPENNVFPINEKTSLTFRRFAAAAGRLPQMAGSHSKDVTLDHLAVMLQNSLKKRGLLALSWAVLVVLLPYITSRYKKFPHLFISGKTQSGKTTLASWIMAMFGVFSEGLSIRETTIYAINEMLSYYSGLPVWLDEYRVRDPKCEEKNDFLKNAYDRQGGLKGRLNRQWEEIPVNGCLLVTGEEFPAVHSVLSRCICIELSQKQHGNRTHFDSLNELHPFFPAVFKHVLYAATPDRMRAFFRYQTRIEKLLLKQVKDNRIAFNYSLIIAAFRLFLASSKDKGTLRWFVDYAVKDRQIKEAEKLTLQFLTDVVGLIEDGFVTDQYYILEEADAERPRRLYLALEPIYRKWEKEKKLRAAKVTYVYKTLVRDLRDEDFYMLDESENGGKMRQKKILGRVRRCVCLDVSKLPIDLREDFENFIDAEVPQKGEGDPL